MPLRGARTLHSHGEEALICLAEGLLSWIQIIENLLRMFRGQ